MNCSAHSLEIDEPLAGTAADAIHSWILIEYPRAWPARFTIEDLQLPPAMKNALMTWSKQPGHKCLLIRQPKESQGRVFRVSQKTVWVAKQDASLDWSMQDTAGWSRWEEPIVLVCTHGSRDRCCGTLGGMVFASLARQKPAWVWQCSHLGGHRFAPTLLTFPDGMMYGRVPLEHCSELLTALAEERPWRLEYQRGNTQLPRAVQALDIQLRKQYQEVVIGSPSALGEKHFLIKAQCDQEARTFEVRYQAFGTVLASCGDTLQKEIGTWIIE